jgi:Domain of unknown function (DUF4260)
MRQGFVRGGPRVLLRIEGLAYVALALTGYAHCAYAWWFFAALILVPDVSMFGYLINPSIGAASYNLVRVALRLIFYAGRIRAGGTTTSTSPVATS